MNIISVILKEISSRVYYMCSVTQSTHLSLLDTHPPTPTPQSKLPTPLPPSTLDTTLVSFTESHQFRGNFCWRVIQKLLG